MNDITCTDTDGPHVINAGMDNTPPVITCPMNITVNTDAGLCTASGVTLGTVTVTDKCNMSITPANNAPATYALGVNTVTWTADDGNGNTTTCLQTVTVVDNQPPATPTLSNVNAECSATPTAPTTTDHCAGTITGTTTTVFPITAKGTTVVTWTFDDGNGNSTTANQNVIIVDATWYKDGDGDTWFITTVSCNSPGSGWSKPSQSKIGDCNDANAAVNPGAAEVCDGVDNNCNGIADEVCGFIISYRDADGDGFGNPAHSSNRRGIPAGFVTNNRDCNDADFAFKPGATEICDGKDNDCDGLIDEGLPVTIWYRDSDKDGYGDKNNRRSSCLQPAGFVANSTDCNDKDKNINPGAPELCDGKDNNCNRLKDEGCSLIVSSTSRLSSSTILEEPGTPLLEVRLWPNPATTTLMVTLDEFEPNKKLEIALMTVEGRTVQVQSLVPQTKGQQVVFDVRALGAGIYLVKVQQGTLTETKKVLVVK
jgi:hypothetical protein